MKKKKNKIPKAQKPDIYYYLETSAQIKRFFGHSDHKNIINNLIKGKKVYSSLFIFREYKQTVIAPLVQFYFLLKEEKNITDAVAYFLDKSRSSSELKEFSLFIFDFLSTLETREDLKRDKNKALIEVKKSIIQWYDLFDASIDYYVENKSALLNTKVELGKSDEEFAYFKNEIRCNGRCGQSEFWKKTSNELLILIKEENILKHNKNKGYSEIVPLLKEAKDKPERADMKSRCQKLGDVIIAIECPQNFRLISLDKAFFAHCEILNKKYLIIPSLSGLKKGEKIIQN